MARAPIPLPVPVEDIEEEECPKCPPPGAPAWMATFADIATLLMAFFVLILSFAEFNQPKFKMVAGSLKQSFGVQREIPVFEQPKGTTILDLKFSPSPEISVTEEVKQETTDTEAPDITQPETEDKGQGDAGDKNDSKSEAERAREEAAEALAEAIQDALEQGQVKAETRDGEVVLSFQNPTEDTLADQLGAAAEALETAQQNNQGNPSDVMMDGLGEALSQIAKAVQDQKDTAQARVAEGQAERSAALAEAELRVALQRQVSQGLVSIEQREDKVVVTVGAGGAFPSGDADLTAEAREIMARLAFSAMSDASSITVTGHTDTVPLSGASPYRDNWGLAAARASSVVRELSGSGLIDEDRLTATSRGESAPVSDNDTAEGREKNRRIEIEINY
ncbi:MAG: flagellar motor protein MotB [Phaeobacter gallaeciensis]